MPEETKQNAIMNIEDRLLLDLLSRVKKHRATVPTHTPRNLLEQFELYENGADYRLYVYLNGTWRYVTLT